MNTGTPEWQDDARVPAVLFQPSGEARFLADPDELITRSIGKLENGRNIHFYSWANFNLVKLILYLLKQTGPANLMMTSYSFSQKSIEALNARKQTGLIRSMRVLVDNRVKVMSPKPFQMLAGSFEYRCTSVHAKVALIWNENWKISVITSQNATDNPKLERGIIFTDPDVFEFDYKTLSDEFDRGSA
ncbi:MAG: hypothetical protein FD166_1442 [Bacteroidetes bacterium]|nr:MAG: hypothetical protein FD166_1442 [Bacteroidota bacterium]